MATTKLGAEIAARPEAVYAIVADPTRLPDWDVTYHSAGPIERDHEGRRAFTISRTLSNRGMNLACHIVQDSPPAVFAFACTAGHGEMFHERFALSPGKNGGTTFSRETEFELPGQDLGVVTEETFTQAGLDRSVEQAFARLNALFGRRAPQAAAVAVPGSAETRSEDSGPIAGTEPYSAHPGADEVPSRPT